MGRHVAVRKAPTPADAGGAVAGRAAGSGIGSAIGGALGSIIPFAGTAAGASAGGAVGGGDGGAVGKGGAKKIEVGPAGIAQNQANAQATQSQQTMQNNIQGAKDTAQQAKDRAGVQQKSQPMDLAWQMMFKAGIEVHHDEPLPQEFTQDITTLDRQHKMVPTENGTMIDNINPHMLRTIELMAQNHKDDVNIAPKPFEMPTTFY